MIRFACPRCGSTLSAPDDCAGRASRCKCGQALTVPAPPDKTALGEVVRHVPTQIPGPKTAKSPPKPPATPDKTALGQVTAHRPTNVKAAAARKAPPPAAPNRPAAVGKGGGFGAGMMVFLFATGASVAFGLFWFLHAQGVFDRPTASVAKGPEPKQPAAETDKKGAKKEDKSPADNGAGKDKPEFQPVDPPNDGGKKSPDEVPPPAKKEEKKPPKEKPADELAPLIAKLKDGDHEQKTKAAETVGAMGEKGRPAATALCWAATSQSKDVARAALQALEKVAPELHEPVFTLLIDGQAKNHLTAITKLHNQGEKAKPSVPVMIHQIEKCRNELRDQFTGKSFRQTWNFQTLIRIINDHMTALTRIAPESPEALQAIIETTKLTLSGFVGDELELPFRSTGIGLLGSLGDKRLEHRKTIVPQLVQFLEEAVDRVNRTTDGFWMQRHLSQVDAIGVALVRCGKEAADVLVKKVTPLLKDLEFHKDAAVRDAAKAMKKHLEAGPGAMKSAFPVNSLLAAGEQRTFPLSMTQGKTYVIELRSSDFDAYLRLRNPFGQEVAQDDDSGGGLNARIVFQCPTSGNYVIEASALGGQGAGAFILDVREQAQDSMKVPTP